MGRKIKLKPKGSKGEQKIATLLTAAGIPFQREYKIKDLNNGLLRFDFWLLGRKWAIELQGLQHYQQVKVFQKTKADFLKAQERDRQKISYCLAHGYKIYCIPFWELDNIYLAHDLFQDKYLAKSKWKNDEDWKHYQASKK